MPVHIRNPGQKPISYVHFAPKEAPGVPVHIRNPGQKPISYVHFALEEAPGVPVHAKSIRQWALKLH